MGLQNEMSDKILYITNFAKQFPDLSDRLLGFIEKKLSQEIYEDYLQGELKEIYYPTRIVSNGFPQDRVGRRVSHNKMSRRVNK